MLFAKFRRIALGIAGWTNYYTFMDKGHADAAVAIRQVLRTMLLLYMLVMFLYTC